ncbi:MAG: hypothetical protein JSR65_04955 [Proteobacteria bacterium]|nr:hypothetical protein [Pseudomonadota bacterium]
MGEDKQREIWFPAKRYGWGWGPPVVWQGWLVFAGYFLLVIGGAYILLGKPTTHASFIAFAVYLVLLTFALIAVCWIKGEKPKWRWGGKG